MNFESEKELQAFVAAVLTAAGEPAQREVMTDGGRFVDVLSPSYAVECKKVLTRNSLLQAAGQMGLYQNSFPEKTYVLAGLSPANERALKSAKSAAADIEQEFGYETWFIDELPLFQGAWNSTQEEQTPIPEPQKSLSPTPLLTYPEEELSSAWFIAFTVLVVAVVFGVMLTGEPDRHQPATSVDNETLLPLNASNDSTI